MAAVLEGDSWEPVLVPAAMEGKRLQIGGCTGGDTVFVCQPVQPPSRLEVVVQINGHGCLHAGSG